MAEVSEYKTLRNEIAGVPIERLATEYGGAPLFVYDASKIVKRCAQLRPFGVVRYAQKACSNIAIIKLIREQGILVDAVSAAEVKRALVAGYKPEEIAYTADIFDEDALDIVTGEARGCVVNVGSTDMIGQLAERLGDAAKGSEITIRVNPGFGHGHSRKTNTGGDLSKHGIWYEQVRDAVALADNYGMSVSGVHMHIGSGTDFEHLGKVCSAMESVASEVGASVKTISCGGGLPIPYTSGEEFIDLEKYAGLWHETIGRLEQKLGHKITLEIEPGRYIVAESGYLIAQIKAIKSQGANDFYLLDAGFTHLARPMMYGSYHPISIARNPALPGPIPEGERDVVVGGPLCESGDVFTQGEGGFVEKRTLPNARVGDYLILEVAGAYGAAMSSNYNSKFIAPEVLIENGVPRLIRKKQTFEQLIENEII
ncbi:MAG: diaminopimelate decarboxylase [Thermoguttaceae bacterium]|jgi:diaminopimelate decarboxylase